MGSPTRRDILQSTAGALAVGVAGCSSGATDDRCGTEPPSGESTIPTDPVGSGPSLSADAAWPMYQHDAGKTGYTTEPDPADDVRLAWTTSPGEDADGETWLVVVDGTVVVTDDEPGVLRAMAPANGSVEWRVTGLRRPTAPAGADGRVVVGDAAGLHAFDIRDGTKLWTFAPESERTTSEPAETPAGTTKTVTTSGTTNAETTTAAADAAGVYSPPTVAGDAVLARFHDGVYAVERDGRMRWRRDGYLGAVGDGTVYLLGSFELRAVELASGRVRWTRNTEGMSPQMAVRDGVIYSGTRGVVTAVDADTGDVEWRFDGENEKFRSPTVTPETVVAVSPPAEFGGGGNLYALDRATGDLLWCQYLGGTLYPPAATRDTAYVCVPHSDGPGAVAAYSLDDGRVRWRYRPADDYRRFRAPAVAGGLLVVGSAASGGVYAFAEK